MYKRLYVLVVLAVIAGMLVACAGASPSTGGQVPNTSGNSGKATTLRVLIHNNPPFVDFMNSLNAKFMQKYPNVKVDMGVVNSQSFAQVTQTRLTANDVDVVDIFGFSNKVEDYMKNVEKPAWQKYIEAGLLLDLTNQPFIKNYDPNALKDAATFNGKIYEINTGRYAFSGVFYNKDMFDKYGVKVPTTWNELVAACQTFQKNNIPCMTSGGKDVWPLQVAGYGILESYYPDQAALVKGLWTGTIKFNDAKSMQVWQRFQQMLTFMEPGVSGIDYTSAPGRFAAGKVAMYPAGTWDAPAIEKANPGLHYGYFPMPGSDNPDDNKYLGGKYDVGFAVTAKSPNQDAALKWMDFFSQPDNYQAYVNAVGILPTQPSATLNTTLGKDVQPYMNNFRLGFELIWVAPKGSGKYAFFSAAFYKPFGEFSDSQKLANQAQSDLEAGLKAAK